MSAEVTRAHRERVARVFYPDKDSFAHILTQTWIETGIAEGIWGDEDRAAEMLATFEAELRAELAAKDQTYPRKAIEVRVTANGFTWDEVLRALEGRVSGLKEHHELGAGCSASGYGASHTADVMLRDVTREQFADESIAWLEQQKRPAELAAKAELAPERQGEGKSVWIVEWHDSLGKGTLAGYAFFTKDQAERHIEQSKAEDEVRAKHGRKRAWEGCTWTATRYVPAPSAGESMAAWVAVSERLPEVGEPHLLYLSRKHVVRQGFRTSGKLWFLDDGDPAPCVTHWMPLPAPPAPTPELRDSQRGQR